MEFVQLDGPSGRVGDDRWEYRLTHGSTQVEGRDRIMEGAVAKSGTEYICLIQRPGFMVGRGKCRATPDEPVGSPFKNPNEADSFILSYLRTEASTFSAEFRDLTTRNK